MGECEGCEAVTGRRRRKGKVKGMPVVEDDGDSGGHHPH